MKKGLVFILILTTILYFNAIGQNLQEFKSQLIDCGMNLTIPSGFEESKIIENDDMEYEYAIKYPDKDFELRYATRPITYKTYSNDSLKKEIEDQIPFRNSQYGIILETIVLNITGGVDYEIQEYGKDDVKIEFNADWGAVTFVNLNSEFGKGFKYCMIVAIHKDYVADAYYFYLANSKENFSENMEPLFHTLRFD